MKLVAAFFAILMFAGGMLAGNAFSRFDISLTGETILAATPDSITRPPNDHIRPGQIHVLNDRVIITLNNTDWARFTDTGSMLPVLGTHANSLEIMPESPTQVQVGDIISFRYLDSIIIHRVIETGQDEYGWYARTKGDNSPLPDPYPVRFQNITGIVVGIFY